MSPAPMSQSILEYFYSRRQTGFGSLKNILAVYSGSHYVFTILFAISIILPAVENIDLSWESNYVIFTVINLSTDIDH